MTLHPYRSHTCGALRATDAGATVRLSGWVHTVRDHGSLLFVDLRDRYGLTQLVFRNDPAELYDRASLLRSEWVIRIDGTVALRGADQVNPKLETGEIELMVSALEVLSEARTPPFEVANNEESISEELRFRYRYLDLRRPHIARLIHLRHELNHSLRQHLAGEDFLEVETPILNRSTPEGARDYLVPSRIHQGSFYALPQSPQIFKQILMVSGMDRYFQIARCFRDEDLRADRQPEFTQLDIEMSFVTQDDIFSMMEAMFVTMMREVMDIELSTPFARLPYAEAVARYGTDRPDLRFGLELIDLSSLAPGCGFGVFEKVVEGGGAIKAIRLPGGASYSRKQIDLLTKLVAKSGAKGLAWLKGSEGSLTGSIAKFFTAEALSAIQQTAGMTDGDLLLAVADQTKIVHDALHRLRGELAQREGLIPEGEFNFLWVVDFPLFGADPETGEIHYEHHPFTAPSPEHLEILESDPLAVQSQAYDLVLNGFEVSSGSIRNHDRRIQQRIFEVLQIGPEEQEQKFGWFLECLEYGTPPHGGLAFGLDRIAAVLAGCDSIREVIAFPKTARAACLLSRSPAEVTTAQLEELSLTLKAPPAAE